MAKKYIDIMDTTFRDGFQSVFGARVAMDDFLPAVSAAREAGISHFEFGGGARFQSLFFYLNENAFDMMDKFHPVTEYVPSLCDDRNLRRDEDSFIFISTSVEGGDDIGTNVGRLETN